MPRLVADGTTHLICTPHIRPGLYDNDKVGIDAALADYRAALASAGIPLAVGAAAEVRFGLEVMSNAERGALPLLGVWQGQRVVLLEFPHTEVPYGAERLTGWLIEHDILPMIAHPERNRDIVNDAERLQPFLDQGCLMQITAGAVTGQFGEGAEACAERLIARGDAHCIASDAHNTRNRVPGLTLAAEAVERRHGSDAARTLVIDNPWHIAASHFAA